MGYITSIVNLKGGVGKTTLTVNLGACLARDYKRRILIIDLDTQVNATLSMMPPLLFAKLKKERRTLKTLISQAISTTSDRKLSFKEIIYHNVCQIKGLDIIAGDVELYDDFVLSALIETKSQFHQQSFEKTWNNVENNLMRVILKPALKQYDLILLDFPPSDTLITRSALIASDFYMIPAKAEPLSVVGIGLLESRLKQFKDNNRTALELLGVIYTSREKGTQMEEKVKERLEQEFTGERIFKTEIPFNVAVAEAVDYFKPVVLYSPKSPGAKAFTQLSTEFLRTLAKAVKIRKSKES